MKTARVLCLAILLAAALGGCESLRLKLKGGSQSGIDWGVGIVF